MIKFFQKTQPYHKDAVIWTDAARDNCLKTPFLICKLEIQLVQQFLEKKKSLKIGYNRSFNEKKIGNLQSWRKLAF